jgi:hypothetical protein
MSTMMDDRERYKDQWTLSRYQRRVSPSPGLTATYSDNASMFDWSDSYIGDSGFFCPPDYTDGIVGLALGGKM